MAALTRRRSTDAREECWHIYYGDVRVGTIAKRVGNPFDTDPWQWSCGFYPGSHPGEHQDGTAATFDEARADFEQAWTLFLSKRTEADFQAWRDHQAAVEALLLVVELNGPTMMARIGMLRGGCVREFDSSRKDTHWG